VLNTKIVEEWNHIFRVWVCLCCRFGNTYNSSPNLVSCQIWI